MNRDALTTVLIFIWALLFTHLVRAATLAEFMGEYDTSLIYWAAGLSILGGWLRTILSLQGDSRVIREKFTEWLWDTFKALISGMFAFFVIQAVRSLGYAVPNELRFGAVVAAGWGGMAFVYWCRDLFTNWVSSKVLGISIEIPKTKDKP